MELLPFHSGTASAHTLSLLSASANKLRLLEHHTLKAALPLSLFSLHRACSGAVFAPLGPAAAKLHGGPPLVLVNFTVLRSDLADPMVAAATALQVRLAARWGVVGGCHQGRDSKGLLLSSHVLQLYVCLCGSDDTTTPLVLQLCDYVCGIDGTTASHVMQLCNYSCGIDDATTSCFATVHLSVWH